jgi:RNA polymerase sigma-B factor
LRDALIEEHLNLAGQLARRFTNRVEPYDDLYQVASMALVKAVDRFDPDRNVKFSTFAVSYIVGELKRHFRDRGWGVRAPRRVQELYLEIGTQIEELSHTFGRTPTIAELSAALNTPVDAVLEAMEAGRGYRAASLDDPNVNEAASAAAHFDHNDQVTLVETREILQAGMEHLTPRERQLIHLRFVEELTQSEIARRLGVSQMHVSRLLEQCLARLRRTVKGSMS